MSIEIKQTHVSPEYVLLGFLYQHTGHGYELHKRLVDEFGFIWHVSQSQTYNILKRLSNQGYITATVFDQEKLPSRQSFHLNESGRQRFVAWLTTPTRCSVHAIRVEFITRLYFVQKYQPDKILQTICSQASEVSRGISKLEDMRQKLHEDQTVNSLALDLRTSLLKSIISWLDECLQVFSSDNHNAHG